MRILIIGGGGMVGQKLAARLAADKTLRGQTIDHLTLYDIVDPPMLDDAGFTVECLSGDMSTPDQAQRMVDGKPDVIFHLASIVSGQGETDFDLGWRVNMMANWHLFEAIRNTYGDTPPRLVFTSSIAVFGAPFPDKIPDEFQHTPLTSYGAQKSCTELMLADFTRKGFLDGVGIRLPTIVVRPGKANLAASSFFSGIIREPLNGVEAICPVDASVQLWMASPKSAAGFLVHAAEIDGDLIGPRRNLTMPGLAITVGEMVEALERVAGSDPVKLIKWEKDPFVDKIVAGWPRNFDATRAADLGFVSESNFDDIIRTYIDEDFRRNAA